MSKLSARAAARWTLLGVLIVSWVPAAVRSAEPVPVQWRSDYDTARKEAAEKGLPLLVEVGTEECMYCKKMEATTFKDPAIAALLNTRFIPLRIDANKDPAFAQKLRVQVYPTTVLAGPDGKILSFLQGYVSSDQFKEHANRAVLSSTTPDWVARDLEAANKALSGSDYVRAVSLLKGIVSEAKPSPARTKAEQVLGEMEQSASNQLAMAKALEDKGETSAAVESLSDLMRRFAGTKAAGDAATRLAGQTDRPQVRTDRARDLLAQAREEFRGNRYADCLDRCEHIAMRYADLPEAKEAGTLAAQVNSDPDRLAAACEQLNERTARMYLALADTWAKKGQAKEAAGCLEKVVRLVPNSRHAEAAQAQLAKLQRGTDTFPVGFDKPK